MVNLDPGAQLAGFMAVTTLLHTQYRSIGACGFREDFFFKFLPIVSLWKVSVAMEIENHNVDTICSKT